MKVILFFVLMISLIFLVQSLPKIIGLAINTTNQMVPTSKPSANSKSSKATTTNSPAQVIINQSATADPVNNNQIPTYQFGQTYPLPQ